MVGDKGFVNRFTRVEIESIHPFLPDEGFEQLTEDGAIREESFVSLVVNVHRLVKWLTVAAKPRFWVGFGQYDLIHRDWEIPPTA